MAWIRSLKIVLSGSGEQIDLSALRVKFTVEQITTQSPNTLFARVYNPSKETAQKIVKGVTDNKLTTVELHAGYEDEGSGLIFKGEITQPRKGRENPVDTYVDIFAKDAHTAYNYAVVNKTLAKGSTPKDHFNVALAAMKEFGVTGGYLPQGLFDTPKYPRAASWFCGARDLLRTLAQSKGCTWSIQNGKLQMVPEKTGLPGGAFIVNSTTGMIGMPIETPGGIIVRTLINASVQVNTLLQINEDSIQRAALSQEVNSTQYNDQILRLGTSDGVYKVLWILRIGDTRGQEWYQDCTCIGASTGAPPDALTQKLESSLSGSPAGTTPAGIGSTPATPSR